MRGRYETPDTPAGGYICRTLRIPNSELFLAIVSGALDDLTKAYNFAEVGDLTPTETADLFSIMYDEYRKEQPCLIGTIFAHASSTAPLNSLACDGATHNRSDYPDLYDSLDAAYRIGSTQFFTPDLRGRVLMGDGTGAGLTNRPFATPFGTETHSLTIGQMPSHSHTYLTPLGVLNPLVTGPVPNASASSVGGFVGSNGSGLAHNNMQPSLPLHYAIWAK